MPELPEVEITRRGLLPLLNQTVKNVVIRNASMRWPIPAHLPKTLKNQKLISLNRRAKYILATFQNEKLEHGTLLLHLGMSGHISLLDRNYPPEKHDHFDIEFQRSDGKSGQILRLNDPRRFGAVLWAGLEANKHALLQPLGLEPLSDEFNEKYLHENIRTRSAAIKTTIMDGHLVVGVGNIYASESLFRARINPQLAANKVSLAKCKQLADEIKNTLNDALKAGGSSLRDFVKTDGTPGYFQQEYFVYGRTGEPCKVCGKPIKTVRLGQRSTFYCKVCQR